MEQTAKIYIAGHRGMVGSGLERKIRKEGYNNIVTRTSSELDLRNQQAVNDFFEIEKTSKIKLSNKNVITFLLSTFWQIAWNRDSKI